jgi:hypothetical protein
MKKKIMLPSDCAKKVHIELLVFALGASCGLKLLIGYAEAIFSWPVTEWLQKVLPMYPVRIHFFLD